MPSKLDRPSKKYTARFFSEDIEYLKLTYTKGYNQIVRALVARHVRRLRTRTIDNLEASGEQLTHEELESV